MHVSLLCLLLKKRSRYGKSLSREENVWCEYKVSVCVLLSVLFLMMSVIYTTTTKLYFRKRESEKFVVKISVLFFFGFSSLLRCSFFFLKPQEGVFMRSVCAIKSFVYICVYAKLWLLLSFLDDVTLRARQFANWVVLDSCCRGGSVHIWVVRCRTLFVRPERRSNALWRFRASTSNSPSGRSWPHPRTPIR